MKNQSVRELLAPRFWPIWCLIGLLWLLAKLPYKQLLSIGKILGKLAYSLAPKAKHVSQVNIALCFPHLSKEEQQTLLKKSFQSLGIGLIETALTFFASDKKLKPLFHLHGIEHIHQALSKGKGVILCSLHFTCLELMGRLLAQHAPLIIVYRPQKNPILNYINHHLLPRHYEHVLARGDIRGIVKHLRDNKIIGYTTDIDAGLKNSIFVPFFGIPTASITATSRFAKLSGAAVIPCKFYRRDDGSGYDFYVYPALENFPSEDIVKDITRINQEAEIAIRGKPEQYLWQYKRFKTRPNGEARFY